MSKSILVIDGDRPFASRISAALQARGVEARVCGDGPEGLEAARSRRPDLILLSVELPTMSGYAVCNRLKKDEQLRSVPLVLTSSEATAETFEQHRRLRTRAEEYLLKPFEPAALLQRVAALIDLPAFPDAAGERAFGEEDLQLIDRVFDELAGNGVGNAVPADPGAMPAPVVVPRVEAVTAAGAAAPAELQRLRARVAELEAELARMAESLGQASDAARDALERASAAEVRATAAEARARQGDALRDKARRALAVVLQALDEAPAPRSPPAEVPPRRE